MAMALLNLGRLALIFCTLLLVVSLAFGQKAKKLTGGYSIRLDRITLSGLSTGGTFAEAVHLAHSRLFSGIGIFSAFFWKCGDHSDSLEQMYATCGKPGGYPTQGKEPKPGADDPALAIKTVKAYARQRKIDNLDHLAPQKIFIWQGTVDEYITPNNGLSAIDIYEPYLYSPDQIHTKIQYSHHHFPTLREGTACPEQSDYTIDAFLGHCQYFGAYHMLNFLLGRHLHPLEKPRGNQAVGKLTLFDQSEFLKDAKGKAMDIGMADEGYLYVPRACKGGRDSCFLHLYFHGCFLTKDQVGTQHIEGTGLLPVAERNGIIMVFVMAKVTSFNSGGCLDSFGYTGKNYATKSGKQIKVVRRIMKRLLNDNTRDENDEDFEEVEEDEGWPPKKWAWAYANSSTTARTGIGN